MVGKGLTVVTSNNHQYFIQIKRVCVCVTEVMSLPILGPISACIVSATVTWPHCEPVVLPHYYTLQEIAYL